MSLTVRHFILLILVAFLPLRGHAFPRITSPPTDQSVLPDTTLTLRVVATGNNPLRYQWRLNGVNIPGANSDTLVISNIQQTNAGSYRVIVVDPEGIVSSPPATIRVSSTPDLVLSDKLEDSPINNPSLGGIGRGSNNGATREPGEPAHAGRRAISSVWYTWQAPADGMATFSTRGSTFDTVLAVYQGTNMTNLVLVASDEDAGGFLASSVSFRSLQIGQIFHIAVDGVRGATGDVVLSWDFEFGNPDIPKIFSHPQSQTVARGSDVVFAVETDAGQRTYQWFFNGTNLSGATSPSLTVPNVQPFNAGIYEVAIISVIGFPPSRVVSRPAVLEIGPAPDAITEDKFGDLIEARQQQSSRTLQQVARRRPANSASVSAGSLGTQIFDNFGATTENGEPNHGDTIGGSSRWFDLFATSDGVMEIDTIGSNIDTVLAVYTGNDLFSLNLITNDNNGAPDGIRSKVRFNAVAETDYLVAIDGVDGEQGNISLNWKLGNSLSITQQPTAQSVVGGGSASFTVGVSGLPAPVYQWRFNGTNLSGATNSLLLITNVQSGQTGSYLVTASNFVGGLTSAPVTLSLIEPPTITANPTNRSVLAGGNVQFSVAATGTAPLNYQWRFNGSNIPGWTGPVTPLFNLQTNQAGIYEVVVNNAAGARTSSPAILIVRNGLRLGAAGSISASNGVLRFLISITASNQPVVIDASTNLTFWEAISTNLPTGGALEIFDPITPTRPRRYYRARESQ